MTENPPRPRRRALLALVGLALVGGLVWAAAFFQPWKAFIDDVVDEAFPAVPTVPAGAPSPGTGSPDAADAPTPLAVGTFEPLDHPAAGGAVVYRLPDDSRILRLEELRTDNGPDLFVYLTTTGVGGPVGDGVNLGALKGNIGSQNYEVPADVDLAAYDTVVIWCRQFDSSFGAAALEPAA